VAVRFHKRRKFRKLKTGSVALGDFFFASHKALEISANGPTKGTVRAFFVMRGGTMISWQSFERFHSAKKIHSPQTSRSRCLLHTIL
jgi:hypothetical protein